MFVSEYLNNTINSKVGSAKTLREGTGGSCVCPFSICYFCELDEVVVTERRIRKPTPYVSITSMYPAGGGDTGNCEVGCDGNNWNFGAGGAGSFNPPNGIIFDLNNVLIEEGKKPLKEFDDKCIGMNEVWDMSKNSNNEYAAVITIDGAILITQELNHTGGGIGGIYSFDGNTYYQYPTNLGAPSRTYLGQIVASNRYFIPITSTIHTHSPCLSDGTNGISEQMIPRDKLFAQNYPDINHYIIGCSAIGEFNGTRNSAFNIQIGSLSTLCSNLK